MSSDVAASPHMQQVTRRQLREQAQRSQARVATRPITRRELRERASASAAAPLAASLPQRTGPGSVRADVPPLGAPQADDLDLTSLALTLSRIAVVAASVSAEAENDPALVRERAAAQGSPPPVFSIPVQTPGSGGIGGVGVPSGGGGGGQGGPGDSNAQPTGGDHVRRWAPRMAVLTALGAATVIAPWYVTHAPEQPDLPPVPLASDSAINALSATTENLRAVEASDAQPEDGLSLMSTQSAGASVTSDAADPLASARAMVSASRDHSRDDLPMCGENSPAANGVIDAIESKESLTLSMPLQEGTYRITSRFGPRWGTVHMGTDFAAPTGTPIHVVADGEVIYSGAGKYGRSGMFVIVQHEIDGKKYQSWYVHMYPGDVFVHEGDELKVGDSIGLVGSYGNSTGPHLHFEIHEGEGEAAVDRVIDSLEWLQDHNAKPITTSGPICL